MKTILVDAVNTFVINGEEIFGEMYALLEKYPNPKIILTNASHEQMPLFGLVNLPYEMFTMEHNPDKPDPIYYQTMLGKYHLSADDVVYFEHNLDAVASARSLGIVTWHYDAVAKDLAGLKMFLDEQLEATQP